MQEVIVGVAAAFAGIFLGFWLRAIAGRAEKTQLERRSQEMSTEISAARAELATAQTESSRRAGFESLAAEREQAISRLAAECVSLRADLQAAGALQVQSSARISQLEADLRNERQNLAEKLALLDNAKQALANQFEALAAEILEKKSKSFSDGTQKELGTLLDPLKMQITEFRAKVEEAQKKA